MHVDQSSATVAFLSSVLSPCEKGVVLWGAVISQGQQRTNTHCVRLCVCVFCLLSPTDHGIVWHAWEFVEATQYRYAKAASIVHRSFLRYTLRYALTVILRSFYTNLSL
eukprot:scaffold21854_cov66-Attheya_sp.AAC.1